MHEISRPGPPPSFKHARGVLRLDHCVVMGIVNRTPDSFFDGGRMGLQESVDFGLRLVDEGAEMLDVGAVKAGPGEPVSEEEEARRLLPLIAELARRTEVPLSVETGHPALAARAIEAGAAVINDVGALAGGRLATVCADTGAGLIVMHHGGQIRGRPRHPRYADVVAEVTREWQRLVNSALKSGVPEDAIMVDPGLDFGKTTYHSLELMRRLNELMETGHPVLVAPSRKDVVGETLDLQPEDRLEGTLALVSLCAASGVHVVRVHDVRAAVRTVRMLEAVAGTRPPSAPVRGLWD